MTKRAAIYLRAGTRKRSAATQRAELEAVAGCVGREIVELHYNSGISNAKGRNKRWHSVGVSTVQRIKTAAVTLNVTSLPGSLSSQAE